MNSPKKAAFFIRYWWLYYLLIFILAGIIVYLLLLFLRFPTCHFDTVHGKIDGLEKRLDCGCGSAVVSGTPNTEKVPSVPPDMSPPEDLINCNIEQKSGGEGTQKYNHSLGPVAGKVVLVYDMQTKPDKLEIYYNNELVATTDRLVSGTGGLEFYYPGAVGNPSYCTVVISAPKKGTLWSYTLKCPR